MNLFKISYRRLLSWLIPMRLRKSITKAWLKAQTSQIVAVYGKFRQNRDKNLYELKHGHHVAHLEAMLNDRYDPAFRRIKVLDAPLDYQPVRAYKSIENKPLFVYTAAEDKPVHLWTDFEILFGGIDFIVKLPPGLFLDEAEARAFINKKKLPGMGFEIQ